MERHFHEQLDTLRAKLLEMAMLAEESIALAVQAMVERENNKAQAVIDGDEAVNRLEVEIDERCLKLLALQQPMAVDLRFITSAMKINNDLERIADHAVNIATYTLALNGTDPLALAASLPRMADTVRAMVRESLHCFVTGNVEEARAVCARDDEVDVFDETLSRKLLSAMIKDPDAVTSAMQLTLISKNLERIADLATNIAEEVIFIYRATSIKHGQPFKDVRSR